MSTEIIDVVKYDNNFLDNDVDTIHSIGTKTKNKIVSCFYCREQMEVQETIIIFDSNWFHNTCWKKFSEQNLEKDQ